MRFKLLRTFLILIGIIQESLGAPEKFSKSKINPNFLQVISEFRKLEKKIPAEELRTVATLGLVNGALEAEKNLEKHLTEKVADLILNLNITNANETIPKIKNIESIIERDRSAVQILGKSLDLAKRTITAEQYRMDMKNTLKNYLQRQKEVRNFQDTEEDDLRDRLDNLKEGILEHFNEMKITINGKANETITFLEETQNLNNSFVKRHTPSNSENVLDAIQVNNEFKENLVEAKRRSDSNEFDEFEDIDIDNNTKKLKNNKKKGNTVNGNSIKKEQDKKVKLGQEKTVKTEKPDQSKKEKQEVPPEVDFDENGGKKPGGITAFIADLSGGEEGSDIGAFVGAVTGLVAQLFGPGGLDVPSLISSGTSLLAGLLSNGRNFGTVLGEYIGLAFDGFSGGGGAENNGIFLGNLFGTVLAELSAVLIKFSLIDPEDADEPPKPGIFLNNFLNTFMVAKNRHGEAEDEESGRYTDGGGGGKDKDKNKGSESFGFLKHIVEALVGGITNFLLNASLGSSGGSSKASTKLISGSSGGDKGNKGYKEGHGGHKEGHGGHGGHGGHKEGHGFGGGLGGGHKHKH